jgi:hypothetical protein
VHHLFFDDVLVASRPLPVKRRDHQFAAREKCVAGKAERRPGTECLPEMPRTCRTFDQIGARTEHILNQDWVADHHRLAKERKIDRKLTAVPSGQSSKQSMRYRQERDALHGLRYPWSWR